MPESGGRCRSRQPDVAAAMSSPWRSIAACQGPIDVGIDAVDVIAPLTRSVDELDSSGNQWEPTVRVASPKAQAPTASNAASVSAVPR